MGKEFDKVHIYLYLNHLAVHLKLIQHCQLNILQYKIKIIKDVRDTHTHTHTHNAILLSHEKMKFYHLQTCRALC